MSEGFPFSENIRGRRFINPMASMPAEQFGRSIDPPMADGGPGGGAPFLPPLWLIAADGTHLKVMFGQVNLITPSGGWAGGGNDVGVNVDISGYSDGTYNVYLNATLGADGVPTAVEVDANTSAVPANSTYQSCNLIGIAEIAGGAIVSVTTNLAWAQTFVTCGRDATDPATTPGTYFWELA